MSIGRIKRLARVLRARRLRPPDCVVDEKKVTEYLLNLEHKDGGPKAKFFLAGGFSREKPELLIRALKKHFRDNKSSAKIEHDRFGCEKLIIKAPIENPDGRRPVIFTVWYKDFPHDPPRFVTAYYKGR